LAARLCERLPGSRAWAVDGEGPEANSLSAGEVGRYAGWIDLVGCGVAGAHDAEWIAKLQHWVEHSPSRDGENETSWALCVTRGLESHGNTAINLSGASRVGLYRMLSSEYARILSRHVDVDPSTDESELLEQILAECGVHGDEIEVCYRAQQRYRADLQEQPLEPTVSSDAASCTLASDEVLWITGGTRGIGFACAEHFVRRRGVRRLVLTGRDAFPPRDEWPRAQLEGTPIAAKIRAVLSLESLGAEVRVLSVSLTDENALRQSVEDVRRTFGAIGGVIHCAGTVDRDNPAFVRKTAASMQEVFAPKVVGLDRLLRCFAEDTLRFLLLFSSVSAVVPSLAVGQSDYAAANAYMDYAAAAHAGRLRVRSIQWPSWSETGMGESRSRSYRRLGFLSLTNAQGFAFLDYVLFHETRPVVLPALVDAGRWRPAELLRPAATVAPVLHEERSSRGGPGRAMPADSLAAIRSWLTSVVARELRIDAARIDVDTPLPDYGVDSVMLAQLLRPVSERVGARIDPSIVFEHTTIEAFSRWLASAHGDVLRADEVATEARRAHDHAEPESAPQLRKHVEAHDVPRVGDAAAPVLVRELPPGPIRSDVAGADIAVVGLSCRFPDAANLEEYWRLLAEGRSAIRAVPESRWGQPSRYRAALLDRVTEFDPAFFLISHADACAMDPQALLILEESLSLWYHGGYSLKDVRGRAIGVYLGGRGRQVSDAAALTAAPNPVMATGANYMAANVSRFFDLHGPSMVVDAACSSVFVAMYMAVQSLRSGEIESALVGGTSLLSGDGALRMFEHRGILNDEAAFHLFDRRSKGAILGEGVGAVWLKTVDQALRDGDSIYAVVKGLAINNDGRTAGPAAPNLQAQKDVMRSALARSGKRAEDIGYIEVNGSGSEVTDLLELKAIETVYRPAGATPCELGSMKPNIGHPLCAEGIASFIKCVLMLHREQRVPFLSAIEPMEHFDLAASPFRFSRVGSIAEGVPDLVAINCFADGGTNAHVILEAWRERGPRNIVHRPSVPPALQRVECQPFRASRSSRDAPAPSTNGTERDNNGQVVAHAAPPSNKIVDFWDQWND
jgi:3-oxoacyl-(acyl-carrier-protein) synthase/NAD(P)-dependent dehydrogenase (short-subunit alcohol dehydrogenase family)